MDTKKFDEAKFHYEETMKLLDYFFRNKGDPYVDALFETWQRSETLFLECNRDLAREMLERFA